MQQDRIVTYDVGKQFAETYTALDTIWNQPCGFILAPLLLSKEGKRYKENLDLVLVPTARDRTIYEIEGCPAFKVRQKMVKHIANLGTNVEGLMMSLQCLFTDNFIKEQFTLPNIWLLANNVKARRNAQTELAQRNHKRNQMKKNGTLSLHQQCLERTVNKSVCKHTREIRELQRVKKP